MGDIITKSGRWWIVWHGHIPWAYAGTLCRAWEYRKLIGGKHD